MKIKTSELSGVQLNWAVAKCMDLHVTMTRGGWFVFDSDEYPEFRNSYNDDKLQAFGPSTNWSQGGPIIKREEIGVACDDMGVWEASLLHEDKKFGGVMRTEKHGPTPLIAAMRCYVASKLGDEVEVPDGLA